MSNDSSPQRSRRPETFGQWVDWLLAVSGFLVIIIILSFFLWFMISGIIAIYF